MKDLPPPINAEEFEGLIEAVMSPWLPTVRDEMKFAYYKALDDLDPEAIRRGADRLMRFRLKEDGLPAPGDWRAASEAVAQEEAAKRVREEQEAKLEEDRKRPSVGPQGFMEWMAINGPTDFIRAKARLILKEKKEKP